MQAKGLSLRDIEARSGGRITNSYVGKLLLGTARNPTRDKLAALATGLGVPLKEILKSVGGEPLSDEDFLASRFYVLFSKYSEASEADRTYVDSAIDDLIHRLDRHAQLSPPKDIPARKVS